MNLQSIFTNWKTTLTGVLAAVVAIANAGLDVLNSGELIALIATILGAGQVAGRDSDKSSEESGAKG